MTTDTKFPLTNDDLLPLLDADGFFRFPATPDEYWSLLANAPYRVDYYDHHIIASMSYESDIHSRIAGRFNTLLNNIYDFVPGFVVYNSNRPVYVGDYVETGAGVFNADGMVVSLPRQPYTYRPGVSAETTPVLLIEILSPSTRAYDLVTKLPAYKQMPTLQTILYVEQDRPDVLVIERQAPNRWAETRLQHPTDSFLIAEQTVSLEQVYRGLAQ